jgi:hypothetical protein
LGSCNRNWLEYFPLEHLEGFDVVVMEGLFDRIRTYTIFMIRTLMKTFKRLEKVPFAFR